MSGWELPQQWEIGGVTYAINTDYRDILQIIEILSDINESKGVNSLVALSLFYEDYDSIPPAHWQAAADYMAVFLNCGEADTKGNVAPLFDWNQDRLLIVADINRVAGCEIRALVYLHWWTFVAWFSAIGEGRLSTVVAIRDKLHKGKALEKWEREHYMENKVQIDLKEKYTTAELAEQAKLKAVLGEGVV